MGHTERWSGLPSSYDGDRVPGKDKSTVIAPDFVGTSLRQFIVVKKKSSNRLVRTLRKFYVFLLIRTKSKDVSPDPFRVRVGRLQRFKHFV